MSDPVVAFAPDGTLYFVGLAVGTEPVLAHPIPPIPPAGRPPDVVGAGFVLGVSSDGGSTWDRTSRIFDTVNYVGPDKEWLAIGADGELVLGWHTVPSSAAVLSRSWDGGLTWSHELHPATALNGVLPVPFFGTDGTLHVATPQACADARVPPQPSCMGVWSHDEAGLALPRDIARVRNGADATTGDYRVSTVPVAAVDRSGASSHGRLALAWASGALIPQRWHAEVAVSEDEGASWRVMSPPQPRAFHQTIPRVAISPVDGAIGLLYYEDSGTGASPGLVTSRFVASRDGGASWSAPLDLSPAFDPRTMKHQAGIVFVGDYNGLDVGSDGVFHAAWADGRHGRSDVYAARVVV